MSKLLNIRTVLATAAVAFISVGASAAPTAVVVAPGTTVSQPAGSAPTVTLPAVTLTNAFTAPSLTPLTAAQIQALKGLPVSTSSAASATTTLPGN